MKIFYDERGKNGKYFELQDVEDFPKMKKIKGIFACVGNTGEKISFNYSLENVIDGSSAFYLNQGLESFNSNLSKLENGYGMFEGCYNLTTFTSDLPSLTSGNSMFKDCPQLTSFASDSSGSPVNLSNLTDGWWMFWGCDALTTFTSELPSLTDGEHMFYDCSNLTTFSSNLGSLKSGYYMFYNCKNLTSFASDLSSLTDGEGMFEGCSLDTASVQNIVQTINTVTNNPRIDLGVDGEIVNDSTVKMYFTTIKNKGWNIYVNGNVFTIKYEGCKTVDDVKAVDPNYLTNDIIDGVWTESLADLEQGGNGQWNGGMFYKCSALNSFSSDLSSLTDGKLMFYHCSALTTFTSDLSSLTDGRYMFDNCRTLTTFISDMPSLTNGQRMFYGCSNLTTFNSDSSGSPVNLSSLTNGAGMFYGCSNLTTFNSDMPSLTDGERVFQDCRSLTTFNSDMPSLTDGERMFQDCFQLTTFNSDMPSLTNGYLMFDTCKNLTTFTSDLSSLTNGSYMFYGCSNLTAFTSDSSGSPVNLSSLTNGAGMFQGCSNLTTFNSDMPSLTNGSYMFYNCKLDTDSLIHIAETINDVRDLTNDYADIYKTIHIGIGNTTPTADETELLTEIHNKGWQVYVNGTSDSNIFNPTATTPIDGEEVTTPIPYWAKPQETDEEHAQYVGEDGKFYNILGGQFIFVDDPDTYGLFTSLEDAAANMRLTKIEKNN